MGEMLQILSIKDGTVLEEVDGMPRSIHHAQWVAGKISGKCVLCEAGPWSSGCFVLSGSKLNPIRNSQSFVILMEFDDVLIGLNGNYEVFELNNIAQGWKKIEQPSGVGHEEHLELECATKFNDTAIVAIASYDGSKRSQILFYNLIDHQWTDGPVIDGTDATACFMINDSILQADLWNPKASHSVGFEHYSINVITGRVIRSQLSGLDNVRDGSVVPGGKGHFYYGGRLNWMDRSHDIYFLAQNTSNWIKLRPTMPFQVPDLAVCFY